MISLSSAEHSIFIQDYNSTLGSLTKIINLIDNSIIGFGTQTCDSMKTALLLQRYSYIDTFLVTDSVFLFFHFFFTTAALHQNIFMLKVFENISFS